MLFAGISKAWNNIRENKSTAFSGIITTGISMVILGTVVLVYLNLIALTQTLFQQGYYSVFVGTEADEQVRQSIIGELRQVPNIRNIHIVKADEARADLIASFGETGAILNKIDLPAFPDVIEFSLDRRSLLTVAEIARIRTIAGVDDVISGRETKDQIDTFFNISEFVGIFLISMLIISIVLMIHNSIQLAVRTRMKEIEILKILGATGSFIQLPFVVEGIIIAVFGYLIATGLVYFLFTFVLAGITFNESTYGITNIARFFSVKQLVLVLFSIMVLGLLSSLVATRKVLRELET
jgi:cell division transport system permease protein